MRLRLSIICAMLLVVAGAAQSALPDFSGTWNLDLAKSDFGPIPAPDSVVMVIDHKDPALKVGVTQKSQMGDASNESLYTTDGKENFNKMRGPAGEQESKSTTRWNGRTLETKRTIEAQGMSIGIDDAWELSADGKVLTVMRQLKTPQGDFSTKTVFNKQ